MTATSVTPEAGVCRRCGTRVPSAAPFCPACGWAKSGHVADPVVVVPPGPRPDTAPLGRRTGAWAIDAACVVLVAALAGAGIWSAQGGASRVTVVGVLVDVAVVTAVVAAVRLVFAGLRGGRGSPGLAAMGLRLVRADGGARAGFWRSLARDLLFACTFVLVVGPFTPLFRPDRRGWHDLASGTWLVDPAVLPRPAGSSLPAPLPRQPRWAGQSSGPAGGSASTILPPVTEVRSETVEAPVPEASGHRLDMGGSGSALFAAHALIGRDPAPGEGESVDALIAVKTGDRSISKTHAAIEVDAGVVWVTDRWSTNGTTITVPEGRLLLEPGVRTPLPDGAEIAFGDLRARVLVQGGASHD